MDITKDGIVFDLEYDDQLDGLDDGEQNLEDEASRMLSLWNRDELVKEIQQERELMNCEKEKNSFDFYDGQVDFADIMKDMTPLDGGKVFVKIVEPNPSGKVINQRNTILFDRFCYLEYEPIPFESSICDGKPTRLNLLEGPIIPGLLQAILSLREGERADIMVHPSMAFGPLGCFPLVPGDAFLLYQVKIYKVWDESQLEEVMRYEEQNKTEIPLEEKLRFVEEHKEVANNYLRDDQPRDAIIRYKAGIKCLEELPSDILTSSSKASSLMTTLLQNLTITFNKLEMYKSATKTAKRALFMDPTNTKVYYHLIKARIGVADYSSALKYIDRASQFSSDSREFDNLRLQLNFQHSEEKRRREEIMKKMSKAIG